MMQNNRKGFTLSETLTTVLLLAIIFAGITGGIVAVSDAYQKITIKSEAQTLLSTTISAVSADLRSCTDVMTSGEEEYYFCNSRKTYITYITDDTDGTLIKAMKNGEADSKTILLLTDKTSSSGLISKVTDITRTSTGLFTFKVEVFNTKSTSVDAIESQSVTVRPYTEK